MKVDLTPAEFAHLQDLLSREAGLVFDDSRRDSLGYSIGERLRATGAADTAAYLRLLGDDRERQHLLDEVTIQETHFFRNPPQIRALRAHVLPELLEHAAAHGRRLRIWSAGCSTGEEPYGLAMMLREAMPRTAGT
jgi:chemotaxis protein methyltransferase CheR